MKIKNKLIAALSVVAIACTATAFGISNAFADETVTPNVYEETVCAVKGASVRYVDDTHGAGVKFHVAMEKNAFQALGETAVTGVAICPKGLLGNDTLATSESEQVKKVNAELTGWFESEAYEGAMELIVYVYDIPAANYGTDLAVAAYVTEGETTTWTVQKTFALAEVALTASETETDETLKTQLAGYYTFDYKAYGLNGTAVKEEKVIYGAKLTAPEADDEVCYYANKAKTAEWNFEDGTVKGDVNLYAVAHNYVLKKSATEYWQECEHCGKKDEESVTAYLSGKAYVNGAELTADEAGNYVIGGDKNNQITFDSAETMINQGYNKLRITAKFSKFENLFNAINYNFTFGYKYKTTSVWVDMNYSGGRMYAGAVYGNDSSPYSYGYIKIYDLSGKVVYDYYHKTITDGTGTHGSWSDYYDKLNENTEYVFEFDCSKTSDITILGWQDVTITGVVWGDSKTQVSFETDSINVDAWSQFTLNATTNDGSAIVYSSSDSETVIVSGNYAMGLKAGSAVITAESNGKTATLTVNVTENEAANTAAGKLFQNGKEIVADADGVYKVDTTAAADSDNIHWLTVDSLKTSKYTYLRIKVKFSEWTTWKTMHGNYAYNWGYNYGSVRCFYDNVYSGGGFGGGYATDNSANQPFYMNIYTAADNAKVLDCMNASGWTSNVKYYTMQLDTEYILEFNVKTMGNSFTLGGFDTAAITEITWSETLLVA